jgi:cellulose synthase/poly-beta-1,6-N-acetylglucosamine synthase-like glycosyltransferase
VRVLVIADNCTDTTAEEAGRAGAEVLVRHDQVHRGKPYALDFGLALAAEHVAPEIVAFVDADSVVEDGFFEGMASAFGGGARIAQGWYDVLPDESAVVQLRSLAFALIHWARPLGAHRLGLGTSLKGNGMAMTWDLAREGLPAGGITEDAAISLEYARRGIPVAFAPGARLRAHMASTYAAAGTQDLRWEAGRSALLAVAWRDAIGAVMQGRIRAAHTAMEAGALPLTWVALLALLGLVLAAAGMGSQPTALAATAALGTYLGLGWTAARVSPRRLLVLGTVPRFLLYKLGIWAKILRSGGPRSWESTGRT